MVHHAKHVGSGVKHHARRALVAASVFRCHREVAAHLSARAVDERTKDLIGADVVVVPPQQEAVAR